MLTRQGDIKKRLVIIIWFIWFHQVSFCKRKCWACTRVFHVAWNSGGKWWGDDREGFGLRWSWTISDWTRPLVATFVDNRISRALFMERTEDLKEMLPMVGDRMSVQKLLQNIQQVWFMRLLASHVLRNIFHSCRQIVTVTVRNLYQ